MKLKILFPILFLLFISQTASATSTYFNYSILQAGSPSWYEMVRYDGEDINNSGGVGFFPDASTDAAAIYTVMGNGTWNRRVNLSYLGSQTSGSFWVGLRLNSTPVVDTSDNTLLTNKIALIWDNANILYLEGQDTSGNRFWWNFNTNAWTTTWTAGQTSWPHAAADTGNYTLFLNKTDTTYQINLSYYENQTMIDNINDLAFSQLKEGNNTAYFLLGDPINNAGDGKMKAYNLTTWPEFRSTVEGWDDFGGNVTVKTDAPTLGGDGGSIQYIYALNSLNRTPQGKGYQATFMLQHATTGMGIGFINSTNVDISPTDGNYKFLFDAETSPMIWYNSSINSSYFLISTTSTYAIQCRSSPNGYDSWSAPTTILTGNGANWYEAGNSNYLPNPTIMRNDTHFNLFYSSQDTSSKAYSSLATSESGATSPCTATYTRSSNNPLIYPSSSPFGMNKQIGEMSDPLYINGSYYMTMSANSGATGPPPTDYTHIFLAKASALDQKNWTLFPKPIMFDTGWKWNARDVFGGPVGDVGTWEYDNNNSRYVGIFTGDGVQTSGANSTSLGTAYVYSTFAPSGAKVANPPDVPTNLQATTGNYWVNHTWTAPTGTLADSYNVSVNSTWNNATLVPYHNNTDVGYHGWSNISVFSYNNTEGISATAASTNTQVSNNLPVQSAIGNKFVTEGSWLNFTVSATDLEGDSITYATNATKGSLNANTGAYTWLTTYSDPGTYIWSFNSTDNYTGVDTETITVTVNDTYFVPPAPINLLNSTGSTWVNYTWSAGTGNITNSYNVSHNLTWTNATTDTFFNSSVGLNNWSNITVWSYNSSLGGYLSSSSVSQNTQAVPDTSPPASITSLTATVTSSSINWTWTNPGNADFNHTEIYLGGNFTTNTSLNYYLYSSLSASTSYTLSTRTSDTNYNVNTTWMNMTNTTSAASSSSSSSGGGGGGGGSSSDWDTIEVPPKTNSTNSTNTNSTFSLPLIGNITLPPKLKKLSEFNWDFDFNVDKRLVVGAAFLILLVGVIVYNKSQKSSYFRYIRSFRRRFT